MPTLRSAWHVDGGFDFRGVMHYLHADTPPPALALTMTGYPMESATDAARSRSSTLRQFRKDRDTGIFRGLL